MKNYLILDPHLQVRAGLGERVGKKTGLREISSWIFLRMIKLLKVFYVKTLEKTPLKNVFSVL